MPILDHHREQFDAGTQTKLEIFENYLEAWLPTFIQWVGCKQVHICDFFAGPGRDKAGNRGSPLIIIDLKFPIFISRWAPGRYLGQNSIFNKNR